MREGGEESGTAMLCSGRTQVESDDVTREGRGVPSNNPVIFVRYFGRNDLKQELS